MKFKSDFLREINSRGFIYQASDIDSLDNLMSKKKHIYLPIEIKAREYVSNLLIVNKAINKNYRCYIGAKSSINRLISYKKEKNGSVSAEETKTILFANILIKPVSAIIPMIPA